MCSECCCSHDSGCPVSFVLILCAEYTIRVNKCVYTIEPHGHWDLGNGHWGGWKSGVPHRDCEKKTAGVFPTLNLQLQCDDICLKSVGMLPVVDHQDEARSGWVLI